MKSPSINVYDKGVTTKAVQRKWQSLISSFKTEINVLVNTPVDEIKKIDSSIAVAIESFRNRTIEVIPGGGGQYGQILFEKPKVTKNSTLDFFN